MTIDKVRQALEFYAEAYKLEVVTVDNRLEFVTIKDDGNMARLGLAELNRRENTDAQASLEDKEQLETWNQIKKILLREEESDSGRVFRPSYITSCRTMTIQELGPLLKKVGL